MTKARSYKDDLLKALSDPVEAKEYLNAALEDEPEVFLLALADVLEANSTTDKSVLATNCDRDLYTMPGKDNFQLNNLRSILNKIGLKLAIEVDR